MTKPTAPSDALDEKIAKIFFDCGAMMADVKSIKALIDTTVVEARIDELERLENAGTNTFRAKIRFVYTDNRLKELRNE